MRSAQSSAQEARQREKLMKERERIASMLDNHETPENIPDSNKMYELWLERLGDKPGVRRNDKFDLIPHVTLSRNVEEMSEE